MKRTGWLAAMSLGAPAPIESHPAICMKGPRRIARWSPTTLGTCSWRSQPVTGRAPLIALLIISTAALYPQSQPASKTKSVATQIVPAQNLDFSGGRLPAHFVPVDPEELYKAANAILATPEKSEFETTTQYQSRVEALSQKPLVRGLKASDDFAIILRPSLRSVSGRAPDQQDRFADGFVDTTYDADSKLMSVSIPTDAGAYDPLNKHTVTAIHRSVANGEPYVGQTAFGVRHLVRVIKVDTLEIDWTDWLPGLSPMTVEPEEARSLKNDIEVIMIGKLRAPYTSHGLDGAEASLEQIKPTDFYNYHRVLYITLDRLIVANGRTGAILQQLDLQQHLQEHQREFPLQVEFRGADVPFSDPRCEQNPYLFPFNLLSIDYSVDGGAEQHEFLNDPVRNGPLRVEAHSYVDVSIRFCEIPRVQVFVGGQPYKLSCEYQEQYIANSSKCARIQVESVQPGTSETH